MSATKPILLLLACCLFAFQTAAQQGIIRGTVIEDANGEPLFGVTVQIKGTTNGAITDFDGKFQINVAPGTYDLQASFISFQTVSITGLVVTADKATVIDQIRLKEDVELLEEVVITAEVVRTTESALLTVKRKSANLIDGISAASFKKIGDSDAAGAVKRVTGVSVEGGKYVFVRGLGDRYTKTMLNSVDIPGLDPDRNSLQIDIFPTNLIDNMIVLKTATAEYPADFTGGVVNIETKDFPEEKILNASIGVSFNPSMHFNSDFRTYDGSSTDWLGFDSDLRQLPDRARDDLQLGIDPEDEVLAFTDSFSPILAGNDQTSFMDYSVGLTVGNQLELNNGNSLGYIFTSTYKSSRLFYDDAIFGEYQRPNVSIENDELIAASIQNGVIGSINTLFGGLAGLAYKTQNSKYKLTFMHLQNGESKSGQFAIVEDPEERAAGKSFFTADNSNNLEYGQRGLTNILLNGEHHLNEDAWVIDWRISPTFSSLDDPDIRKASFTTESAQLELNAGAAGLPSRIWRFLDETNVVGKVDVTRNLQLFGSDAKVKFGTSYLYKERDYEILRYDLQDASPAPTFTVDDPNLILLDENLFPNFSGGGFWFQYNGTLAPNSNAYNSSATNTAFYGSIEASPTDKLKAIFGVRAENFVQRHTGTDQPSAQTIQNLLINNPAIDVDSLVLARNTNDIEGDELNFLNDAEVLDALDFFPSLNLIYELKEKQNLRFSYSRTIARPSFKELSFAQIVDPLTNRTFNGGLLQVDNNEDFWDGNLTETRIDNFDLRWEMFQDRAQTYSLSVFYKTFEDPIEIVRLPTAQTGNNFQPRNVGNGEVYGAEFEFRKVLDFVSPSLDKFVVNGNVTVTESILDMTPVEFEARRDFERQGQTVENTREMAGQAPYVINAGISYEDFITGLDAGLFYNVQGETLTIVGGGLFPDVFSEPFHSLNFNLNKTFGPEDNISFNFSINNILNDKREQFYQGFNASDQVFNSWSPGTSIGLGIGYDF